MYKENKKLVIITSIVCFIPVIAGVILYKQLPDTMITHWNTEGEPNGYMSKFVAAIVLPSVLLIVNLFAPMLLRIDPKYDNMGDKTKALIFWIIPAVSIFSASATLSAGLGYASRIDVAAPFFIGLLFVIIGNYLPKMKQTYTVGIKLPWTLHDEENWNRTHRMAGYLWVVCGLLIMASALIPCSKYVLGVVIAAMVIAPTVYSYMLYRKSEAAE
ncbi:MAG: SdpI family protein [Clostridiales bacterium]|nr:SdpI family protein [Candidatus Crickella merdequi]